MSDDDKREEWIPYELAPGEGPVVRGVLFPIGRPTKNGHIYPRELVVEALANYRKTIEEGRAYGTLGPGSDQDALMIDIQQVSHRVIGLEINSEDEVVADVVILPTLTGEFVRHIIDDNAKSGDEPIKLAPTGYGKVERDGLITEYQLLGTYLVPPGNYPGFTREDGEGGDDG